MKWKLSLPTDHSLEGGVIEWWLVTVSKTYLNGCGYTSKVWQHNCDGDLTISSPL